MERLKNRWLEYSILVVSFIATGGSLYFSEVMLFTPCVLCWYQRILMYPLVILSLMGLFRKDKDKEFWKYVLPISLFGFFIAVYHVYIQTFPPDELNNMCTGSVPCTTKYLNLWGFADISFFSLLAFLIINVLIIVSFFVNKNKKH